MKKIYIITLLIVALFLPRMVNAQSPDKMSYQAVVRDADGALVASQIVNVRITILRGSATGTIICIETYTPTTNVNGLISLEIGTGEIVSGFFYNIDWFSGEYFIKTEITQPQSDLSITATSQLLSVPFAFHAKTVEYDKTEDADADPENELQGISLNNNILSIEKGNGINLNEYLDNTDRQNLTLNGTTLEITNGTSVDLSNLYSIPSDISDLSDNTSLLFDKDYLSLTNLPTLFDGNWNSLTGTAPNISTFNNDAGYLTSVGAITETDPVYTAWDKSTGILITESQISDFGTYLTSYTES
ncbi:MAG: hypothetical protein KAI79_15925, partial [Bacteroidales bacterium]|nr:hypothetical protein [Bacteroidales bacterium]